MSLKRVFGPYTILALIMIGYGIVHVVLQKQFRPLLTGGIEQVNAKQKRSTTQVAKLEDSFNQVASRSNVDISFFQELCECSVFGALC